MSLCNTYTITLVYVPLKNLHKNACICLYETHTTERLFLCMCFRETYTSVLLYVFQRDIYTSVLVYVFQKPLKPRCFSQNQSLFTRDGMEDQTSSSRPPPGRELLQFVRNSGFFK
jgi:hypothetical protein